MTVGLHGAQCAVFTSRMVAELNLRMLCILIASIPNKARERWSMRKREHRAVAFRFPQRTADPASEGGKRQRYPRQGEPRIRVFRLLLIEVGYRRTGKLSLPFIFLSFCRSEKNCSVRHDEIEPSSLLSRSKAFAARKACLPVAESFFSGFQRALPNILRPGASSRSE